jgi:hypothetical protein
MSHYCGSGPREDAKVEDSQETEVTLGPSECTAQMSAHDLLCGSSGMLSTTRDVLSAARMRKFTSNKLCRTDSYVRGQRRV